MKKRVLFIQILIICVGLYASNYHTVPIEINNFNILELFITNEESFENSFYETTGEIYNQVAFKILDCLEQHKNCLICKMKKVLVFTKQYCWAVYKDENGNLIVIILKCIKGIVYYSIQLL